jgi:hypothetical protein
MNWKPAFIIPGEAKPCTNGEVYATKDEALASAEQRFMVWMMPTDFTAVETEEPVNGVWVAGEGRRTPEAQQGHMAPEQVRLG